MPKSKTRKHKQTHIPSTGSPKPNAAYLLIDDVIDLLGHIDTHGTPCPNFDLSGLDKDVLQELELIFRLAMTTAIQEHDVAQFRKSYLAMERMLGIDMENYESLELHFPAEGESLNVSPSELCLAVQAWPIISEVFKLSLAHRGPFIRHKIESPWQLLFRFGSWLIEPELQAKTAEITQLANEAVSLFLAELQLSAKAKGLDMKPLIQGIPFLKQFPPLEKIFWTQYAALPV